jgi:hypothetical protein
MKRRASALTLVLLLLFSAVAGILLFNSVTAFIAYLPTIVIQSDGSVVPKIEFINHTGNVYSLTGNLFRKYAIVIRCSNIVFDGAGHTIDGSSSFIGCANIGLKLENVTNVIVKDIKVHGFAYRDISIEHSSECYILRLSARYFDLVNSNNNTIAESNIGDENYPLGFSESSNNILTRNTITSIDLSKGSSSNVFFANNFIEKRVHAIIEANYWDNGSIGNYWSDYNGTDPDHDGIGNTIYFLTDGVWDKNLNKFVKIMRGQDKYPLIAPFIVQVANSPYQGLPYDPPIITVLSPSPNGTYSSPDVPLNVTVQINGLIYHNIETVKALNYSIDGQTAISMALTEPSDLSPGYYVHGNDTLTGLSDGTHNLTIYLETGISGLRENFNTTISFSVDTSAGSIPEPFPTAFVVVASVAAVIVVAGFLVYFKKRKRKTALA